MLTTVRRVSVGSAFKVGVVLNAILSVFITMMTFILPGILFAGMGVGYSNYNDPQVQDLMNFSASMGVAALCVSSLLIIVVGGVFGGIYFALIAFLYNLTAGWVGGVEVELQNTPNGFIDQIEYDAYNTKRKNF